MIALTTWGMEKNRGIRFGDINLLGKNMEK